MMIGWIFAVAFVGLVDGAVMPIGPVEIHGPFAERPACEYARAVYAHQAEGLPIVVGYCVEKDQEALDILREKGLLP